MAGIGSPLVNQIVNHLGPGLDYGMILDDYLQYQLQAMEENVKLFPEVTTVLAALQESGRRLAIVTSRKRLSLEVLLKITDTSKYFDALVTPEDTGRHKPDPDPSETPISISAAVPELESTLSLSSGAISIRLRSRCRQLG